jgi:predicted XRE-type DNA-binding protein
MNVIEASSSGVHEAHSDTDAGDRRIKAEYVMKIGMLLRAGKLGEAEAAQKLGLSHEEMNEVLNGQLSELTVAKISEHVDLLQNERQ